MSNKNTIGTTGGIGAWVVSETGTNPEGGHLTKGSSTPGFDAQGQPVIGTAFKAVTIGLNGNQFCVLSNPS